MVTNTTIGGVVDLYLTGVDGDRFTEDVEVRVETDIPNEDFAFLTFSAFESEVVNPFDVENDAASGDFQITIDTGLRFDVGPVFGFAENLVLSQSVGNEATIDTGRSDIEQIAEYTESPGAFGSTVGFDKTGSGGADRVILREDLDDVRVLSVDIEFVGRIP